MSLPPGWHLQWDAQERGDGVIFIFGVTYNNVGTATHAGPGNIYSVPWSKERGWISSSSAYVVILEVGIQDVCCISW